ncbi:hypothetical protein HF086_013248 [Spodoptera exigua]|uniref:GST C-terminal domain-containing protein n=1 Tax=Spodoptera exigua TaxID=7107 RepID=A0A922SEZ0_SPOEX|nr:hypothetical protein HF086_013248 [Spodoptera exigua]
MDASPPVRAVYMVIEALKLPEVKYVETDLLNDDHLKDDFLKEPIFFGTATSLKPGGVAKIKSAYDFTEKFLTGSKWLAGNKLTLADISCVATISTLNELLPIDEATHAIVTYLVTKYGKNDDLYPADPEKRAIIDQRLHFDSGILFPSLRGTVEPVLFWGETSFRPENLAKMKKAYEFMEKFLTNSKPWLTGNEVTLADICCVSTLSSMHVVLPIDAEE